VIHGSHILDRKLSLIMAESLSGRWELYPLGDDSTVPIGVDAELYCERFLANTQRLFASEAEKLDVIRVLSRSGGTDHSYACVGLHQVDYFFIRG
jgi:hypothetical protein